MNAKEFGAIRLGLKLTQREMAGLLGKSLRSVQSFEQGWRKIPEHIERYVLFLIFLKKRREDARTPCWELTKCPMIKRERCPAWEFNAGHLCWFINGTICQGKVHANWEEKMKSCRGCKVFEPVNTVLKAWTTEEGNEAAEKPHAT
jgi:hypothetical protein